MKRKIALGCLLVVGCVVALFGLTDANILQVNGESYYDSSINMADSLIDIQKTIVSKHSATNSSKYIGEATVTLTYDSFGVIGTNVSQSKLNEMWAIKNPGKDVKNTCGLVANTMMIMKYIEQFKIKKVAGYDTSYDIYSVQLKYAWDTKIFTAKDRGGTCTLEQVSLANHYLFKILNDYSASLDIGVWSRLKTQLDKKIEPMVVDCRGKKLGHAMLATDCYIQTVNYKEKIIFGITVSKKKDYKIVRVCSGWEDTDLKRWEETTNDYIFFDCVFDSIYLYK